MPESFIQPNLSTDLPPRWTGRFWSVLVLTGIASGLGGGLLMRLLDAVQRFAWSARNINFASAVGHTAPARHVLNLLLAGAIVALGGVSLRRFRADNARTAEVNTAVWFHQGRVATGKALIQGVLSIVNVGLGMSLGREASIKQLGGVAGSQCSQWLGVSPVEQRQLTAFGVGAGMAAAYNVPLGGALFAVEVLLGTFSIPVVLPAMLCSALATATSWLLLSPVPLYHIAAYRLSASQAVWAALVGPLLGFTAVLLVRGIGWTGRIKPTGWRAIMCPLLVFPILGLVSIRLPLLLGNGADAVQLAFTGRLPLNSLAVLPVAKLLAVLACLAVGGSGGLFTPTMMIGAVLGGLLGSGWALIWPGVPLGSCAVIGAAGVLAASTQGPLSSIVLVLELTRQIDPVMVPVLLAVIGAILTARRLESRTVYTVRLHPGTKSPHHVADQPQASASARTRSLVHPLTDACG